MLKQDYFNWEIDPSIYKSLNKNVLKDIYNDGEKRLDSLIDDINVLKTRSYILLSIFISLLGFLIPLLIKNSFGSGIIQKNAITILLLIVLISTTYFVLKLIEIVSPNYVKLKGEEPKQIDFIKMSKKPLESQEEIYLFNSLEVIQDKITFNETLIQSKTLLFESIIKSSSIIFFVSLIIFLIIIKI